MFLQNYPLLQKIVTLKRDVKQVQQQQKDVFIETEMNSNESCFAQLSTGSTFLNEKYLQHFIFTSFLPQTILESFCFPTRPL